MPISPIPVRFIAGGSGNHLCCGAPGGVRPGGLAHRGPVGLSTVTIAREDGRSQKWLWPIG